MTWTKKHIDKIIKMRAEGRPSKDMIKATGKSKGAVLGKLYRLGLAKKKPPSTRPIKKRKAMCKNDIIVDTPKLGVSLLDIKPNQCRYPHDDGSYCGEEIKKGSYCERHYIRCHIKANGYRKRDVPIDRQW